MKFPFPETDVVIEWIHPRLSGGKDVEDSKVAVLLEDLQSQFRVFGEGLQMLGDKVDRLIEQNGREHEQNRLEHQQMMEWNRQEHERIVEANQREHQQIIEQNCQEHRLMMQMIKELGQDFQLELRRVK